MSSHLARVHWRLGQTLLPDHFLALEESLLTDFSIRLRGSGLPAYGIYSLKWNPSLIEEGIISISSLSAVLPSGILVDVPGNARVSPLNLNVSGSANVQAYLHALSPESQGDASDGGGRSGSDDGVERRVYPLVLSTDATIAGAVDSLKLAEFKKAPDGIWRVSDRYVPPLLQVGTSPFLLDALDEVAPALEVFQYKLAMDSASYLSGAALYLLQSTLRSVYRVQRLLANLRKHVHLHPYFVYEALKDFYVEVCFYRGAAPRDAVTPYRHDQLAAVFREILEPLREQMQLAKSQSPYQPFVLREGVQRLELPADIRQVREVFFLVQRREAQRGGSVLSEMKLSSPSRLSMVHKLALEGIPLKRAERPALAHTFGPEVEFYQLAPGEEWEHAVRENSVAFYHRPEYQGIEFYLYWNRA